MTTQGDPRPSRRHRHLPIVLAVVVGVSLVAVGSGLLLLSDRTRPRNVILFIGDGMGFAQVAAGRAYAVGTDGRLAMERLPHHGRITTHAMDGGVTDSAAAATALGTGWKTHNGAIATSSDGKPLETALEIAQRHGKSTGLVTTTRLTHATPACFAAHNPSRGNEVEIAQEYVRVTRPDLLLGGGAKFFPEALVTEAVDAGYDIVRSSVELSEVSASGRRTPKLLGLFHDVDMTYEWDRARESAEPQLWEMTSKALELLSVDPDGFFLMVEGGRIDHAGHGNHLRRVAMEVAAFDRAVQTTLRWTRESRAREANTLILVTADHETGGLSIHGPDEPLDSGRFVEATWTTGGHTGQDVPIWAGGPGADAVRQQMDNTDVFSILLPVVLPPGMDQGSPVKAPNQAGAR